MKTLFRWLFRFAAFVGLLQIVVTATPVLKYWIAALSAPWGPEDGDILIVPGAEGLAHDTMGISTYWRTFYAALVWRKGHFRKVIVSGRDEAPLMRDFLVFEGIPKDSVLVENEATSTRENAQFAAKLLKGDRGRTILLTSEFHMGRALRVFHKAGVDATALPYPDAYKRLNDPTQRWSVFLMLADETVKAIYYRARGWA